MPHNAVQQPGVRLDRHVLEHVQQFDMWHTRLDGWFRRATTFPSAYELERFRLTPKREFLMPARSLTDFEKATNQVKDMSRLIRGLVTWATEDPSVMAAVEARLSHRQYDNAARNQLPPVAREASLTALSRRFFRLHVPQAASLQKRLGASPYSTVGFIAEIAVERRAIAEIIESLGDRKRVTVDPFTWKGMKYTFGNDFDFDGAATAIASIESMRLGKRPLQPRDVKISLSIPARMAEQIERDPALAGSFLTSVAEDAGNSELSTSPVEAPEVVATRKRFERYIDSTTYARAKRWCVETGTNLSLLIDVATARAADEPWDSLHSPIDPKDPTIQRHISYNSDLVEDVIEIAGTTEAFKAIWFHVKQLLDDQDALAKLLPEREDQIGLYCSPAARTNLQRRAKQQDASMKDLIVTELDTHLPFLPNRPASDPRFHFNAVQSYAIPMHREDARDTAMLGIGLEQLAALGLTYLEGLDPETRVERLRSRRAGRSAMTVRLGEALETEARSVSAEADLWFTPGLRAIVLEGADYVRRAQKEQQQDANHEVGEDQNGGLTPFD